MFKVSNPNKANNPFDTKPSLMEISHLKPNSCKACACNAAAINQQVKNPASTFVKEYGNAVLKKTYAKVRVFA